MILQDADIKKIILERPNSALVEKAQDYTKKLMMHIEGLNLDSYIEQINMFEKADLVTIRKKYAVSNKHLFSRLHRPKDNIYQAPGGSVYYNIPDSKKAEFTRMMGSIVYGYSIKKWLKVFYDPATEYDPMGLIMVEVDANEQAYPTYKSVLDIYDYQLTGRQPEYIIFKQKEVKDTESGLVVKTYRVIDDASDRQIIVAGDIIKTVPNTTFPNHFGRVPASIISSIYNPVQGLWVSADDAVVELADQFLRQGSVKNIHVNYFGFPRPWEYASACIDCKGEGVRDGKKCETCSGTGQKTKSDPSETIKIPVPQGKDNQKLAPDVAGYITPDIEGWNKMNEELELLENMMFQTKWGTHQAEEGKSETATGRFIDVQPVNNALGDYSSSTEMMEMFITDLIGTYVYENSYGGSSITYGKRFMLESADSLWNKITDGIEKGAPLASLYDVYNDYLQSRYNSNSTEMIRQMKLSKIEPLPFATYTQLAAIINFPQNILMRKYWFEQWMNITPEQETTYGDVSKLQASFEAYCTAQSALLDESNAKQQQRTAALNNPVSVK